MAVGTSSRQRPPDPQPQLFKTSDVSATGTSGWCERATDPARLSPPASDSCRVRRGGKQTLPPSRGGGGGRGSGGADAVSKEGQVPSLRSGGCGGRQREARRSGSRPWARAPRSSLRRGGRFPPSPGSFSTGHPSLPLQTAVSSQDAPHAGGSPPCPLSGCVWGSDHQMSPPPRGRALSPEGPPPARTAQLAP